MEGYLKYKYEVGLRFRDMDSYGIVHHSNYFSYFEEARCSFAKDCLRFTSEMLEGTTTKFPVLEASCKYRNAITYALEKLIIEIKFHLVEGCKIEFLYTIKDRKRKVYAKGKTVHAIVVNGKLCIAFPQWLAERVETLLEEKKRI